KLFPNLRWRLRLQRWMAPLGIYSVFPEERVWWSDRAARLSGFMDWIEDTEPPAFPPAAEQPPFLRERFLT
ncbi:MAG: hypothetical protein O6913_08250, partial [Chloroflexi bacterium]|nr:hypothetical protein [Chloroflexota bacterium]